MNYEKKYKEAFAHAKEIHRNEVEKRRDMEFIFPELKESEGEKVREDIISLVNEFWEKIGSINPEYSSHSRMLAWLENIPYTIDHEKREGFHLGYKAGLEKQGESSDKIHYWTEEEIEPIISDYLRGAEHYGGMIGRLRCLKPKSLEKQGTPYTKSDVDDAYLKGISDAKNELEKQGQKPAWSEEDEKMCQETIDWFEKKCFPYALESENPARESIKWLKSLKQRIGG